MSEPRVGTSLAAALRLGDWTLFLPALLLAALGILTMHTFGQGASLAPRQLLWFFVAAGAYLVISAIDVRFIRRTPVILALYGGAVTLLALLLVVADPVMGAKAWFTLGPVSFQPADLAKLAIIALLAKYLSRRHVEIADWRHVLVTGAYVGIPALLILVEPDLGNTIIFGSIWLGMMLVSGISRKQVGAILLLTLFALTALWFGGLKPYQRTRILSFVNPAANIQGAGYNAYQARIAVGSGQLFGKGVGHGTQSKLRFLPEYQTDFIFAAFAEEWGYVGVLLLLGLYGLLFKRLIDIARAAATNFDAFFTLGVLLLLAAHVVIHTGINVGLLPVTGTTIPFMSSGGSHLVLEFAALGIVTSLARHSRAPRAEARVNEYLGG